MERDPDETPMRGFADYIATARQQALPADVREKTRQHLLDTIAAMVSGAHLHPGQLAIDFIRGQGGAAEARVVGSDIVTSAINAALANGMLAHADETDDHHLGSVTHPGAPVVPAALAVGERVGASGLAVLTAIALGYDVTVRVALALTKPYFLQGATIGAYAGGFGAAAAAAALLRLDARQVRHMLSYVAQQTGGTRSWQRDPSHVEKAFVLAGAPARNGTTAALMVQAGFEGTDDVFTGEFNFFDFHFPKTNPALLTRGLGQEFEILHTSLKKFCVAGPIEAPLEGVAMLMAQGIMRERIARLDVRVASTHAAIVDNAGHPTLCLQHILGLMLVDGKVDFASLHDIERMDDPEVRRERAKVNLISDADMSTLAPRRPVHVDAVLVDGSTREIRAHAVRGTADNPINRQEVEAKVIDLMAPVLGMVGAREVCNAVAGLDAAADIGGLMRRLAAA